MKEYNKTHMFNDNAMKREFTVIVHWTGGSTATGAMEHLDLRKSGRGSVGYNCIIAKNGTRFILADPKTSWMHNTGKGSDFDKGTISISFVALNASDKITDLQVDSFIEYRKELEEWCKFDGFYCHSELNKHKQDFPADIWAELKPRLLS